MACSSAAGAGGVKMLGPSAKCEALDTGTRLPEAASWESKCVTYHPGWPGSAHTPAACSARDTTISVLLGFSSDTGVNLQGGG